MTIATGNFLQRGSLNITMCNVMDLKTPSDRLKYARDLAGYPNAAAFYKRFHVNQATYTPHEKGTRGIEPDVAKRYAELLGNVSASWLLYGEGDPPRDMRVIPPHPAFTEGSPDGAMHSAVHTGPVPTIMTRASTIGARIEAIRLFKWREDSLISAAAALGIPKNDLLAIESDTAPMPRDALLRFCAEAGVTLDFIERGSMDGLRWQVTAWLGHLAPHLIPGLLESERAEGRQMVAGGSA